MLRGLVTPRRLLALALVPLILLVASTIYVLVVLASIFGVIPMADDPGSRAQVVELARDGKLALPDDERREWGDTFILPDDLAHASRGGEVVVLRDANSLVVVFFDFRGFNHYTGWVYTSDDALAEDPMGNHPFKAERIAPNWFRVDAG